MIRATPAFSRRRGDRRADSSEARLTSRQLAVWLLFALGLGAVLIVACVSAYLTVNWAGRWLQGGDQGGWSAFLPMSLGCLSFFSASRWAVLLVFFAVGYRKVREPRLDRLEWPLVSICVPAFNEAESIRSALQSVLKLDYPNFEVIVVDDGSTDNTFELASSFAGTYSWAAVHVYRKPNGGKWSAHNFAFQRTKGDIILCIDVDSRLDADVLRRGVARLLDDNADAVAGFARIWNRDNFLTNLQALEYVVWNGAVRLPQSVSGDVVCVPGPLGFFRRTALEQVFRRFGGFSDSRDAGAVAGPYQGDTFAEDLDLSLAVLSLGGKIVAEPLCAVTRFARIPYSV